MLVNLMFGIRAATYCTTDWLSAPHFLAELVATVGLILVNLPLLRTGRAALAAPVIGAYVGTAYSFAFWTSFPDLAINIGRIFTYTLDDVAPSSALGYIVAQLIGAALGTGIKLLLLLPRGREKEL